MVDVFIQIWGFEFIHHLINTIRNDFTLKEIYNLIDLTLPGL